MVKINCPRCGTECINYKPLTKNVKIAIRNITGQTDVRFSQRCPRCYKW